MVDAPVSTPEDCHCTRYVVSFSSVRLDPDPTGLFNTEKVVDHFESLFSFRIIGTADIHDALELTLGMVSEEGENGNDSRRRGVQRQLVLEHRELLDELG